LRPRTDAKRCGALALTPPSVVSQQRQFGQAIGLKFISHPQATGRQVSNAINGAIELVFKPGAQASY
jgi:hypothetical protein